jgi:hypothetical protein
MLAKDQGWAYVQAQIMAGNLLYRDTGSAMAGKAGGAVAAAQKKYAREPRSLLGLIPNRAPFRGRAYKVLSQSDLVKFERENEGNAPLFSRLAAANPTTPAAKPVAPLRDRMNKMVDSLIYNFQDRFKPLKDIQKRAGPVPESMDAALAEELYSGTLRARTDDFDSGMREPLIKAIHDSGVAYGDVEEYLHALHAPSRNAAMQEINPTEPELEQQIHAVTAKRNSLEKDPKVVEFVAKRRELRLAEADIEDGTADESLGRILTAELAKLRKLANVHDYLKASDKLRGLRSVQPFDGDNTALSGMSNDEAKAVIAKAQGNGTEAALQRISKMVDAITAKTRNIFVGSGLEKKEAIEAWNKKYDHYVPLRRDKVGISGNPVTGQGFNILGKASKHATNPVPLSKAVDSVPSGANLSPRLPSESRGTSRSIWRWMASNESGKSDAFRERRTAFMPQPISTPTAAGIIALSVAITVPTVLPIPRWQSGYTVIGYEGQSGKVFGLGKRFILNIGGPGFDGAGAFFHVNVLHFVSR